MFPAFLWEYIYFHPTEDLPSTEESFLPGGVRVGQAQGSMPLQFGRIPTTLSHYTQPMQ